MRTRQTNLGTLICKSMLAVAPGADLAILNSGSVRLDDELSGPITQYDIIRTLPFGGKILIVQMKGDLLQRVLEAGRKNQGNGGYLQVLGNTAIEPGKNYHVVLTDFLLSGAELNMSFLTRDNPGVLNVKEPEGLPSNDLRLALIRILK
jgi:5'-nucleotidase